MTLDAHVTGIWCGQIGGGVGKPRAFRAFSVFRAFGAFGARV